jgi:RNA polymerase sigma factor (TIGR02999 family)
MTSPVSTPYQHLLPADEVGLNNLIASVYDELHRLASQRLRAERSDHTLQPTALVHEVYLKLSGRAGCRFANRNHFLATAARVMRQVLVDYARARCTRKRGGVGNVNDRFVSFTTALEVAGGDGTQPIELLELDRALLALSRENDELARLIEMRYFGGMTAEQSAEVLGVSVHVVRHDLRFAHAWLRRELSRFPACAPPEQRHISAYM